MVNTSVQISVFWCVWHCSLLTPFEFLTFKGSCEPFGQLLILESLFSVSTSLQKPAWLQSWWDTHPFSMALSKKVWAGIRCSCAVLHVCTSGSVDLRALSCVLMQQWNTACWKTLVSLSFLKERIFDKR